MQVFKLRKIGGLTEWMTIDDLNAKEQLKHFVIPNINATKTVESSWELNSLNNDKTGLYISLSMERKNFSPQKTNKNSLTDID